MMTRRAEIVLPGVHVVESGPEGEAFSIPRDAPLPFVTGDENLPVLAAMQHVLELPKAGPFSLVLYGPTGSGKTHLLRLLWGIVRAVFPGDKVLAAAAPDFVRSLTAAIDEGRTGAFRATWKRAQWLLLDDIHHLQDYPAAEIELLSIFRRVEQGLMRLAVTATRHPTRLQGLSEGLRSRLSGGYALPVEYPSPPARASLLRLALGKRGLRATPAALEYLVDECPGPAGQVLGLAASAAFLAGEGTIDLTTAKQLLKRMDRPVPPTPGQVLRATSRYFRVPVAELKGPSRSRTVVRARETAVYLIATLSRKSLRQIGKILGGRDHTTISYALRKAQSAIDRDPCLRLTVTEIAEKSKLECEKRRSRVNS
ncbi:MAG: chromosomal replication initiator protein DnaA [Thermogutta sp.]